MERDFDRNLMDYIRENLNKGHSEEQIEKILIDHGYHYSEIRKAFDFLNTGRKPLIPNRSIRREPKKSKRKIFWFFGGLFVIAVVLLIFFLLNRSSIFTQEGESSTLEGTINAKALADCETIVCFQENMRDCTRTTYKEEVPELSMELKILGIEGENCKYSQEMIFKEYVDGENKFFMDCDIPMDRVEDFKHLINDEFVRKYICNGSLVELISNPCLLMKISGQIEEADVCFEIKALLEENQGICDKINNTDKIQECRNKISQFEEAPTEEESAVEAEDGLLCGELTGFEKDDCIKTKALESQDVDLCKEIEESWTKKQCIMGVAYSLKDSSICEEIEDDEERKMGCVEIVTILIERKPYCDNKITQEDENECFFSLALYGDEGEICSEIVDLDNSIITKSFCFHQIAIAESDAYWCERIEILEAKAQCNFVVGLLKEN